MTYSKTSRNWSSAYKGVNFYLNNVPCELHEIHRKFFFPLPLNHIKVRGSKIFCHPSGIHERFWCSSSQTFKISRWVWLGKWLWNIFLEKEGRNWGSRSKNFPLNCGIRYRWTPEMEQAFLLHELIDDNVDHVTLTMVWTYGYVDTQQESLSLSVSEKYTPKNMCTYIYTGLIHMITHIYIYMST